MTTFDPEHEFPTTEDGKAIVLAGYLRPLGLDEMDGMPPGTVAVVISKYAPKRNQSEDDIPIYRIVNDHQ